ncbi:MAG: TRAP transporter substrate-binding protein DctP [Deltaproteobacteria bacterium]|nr:TRAP transporter substrate-binding protein DctP [Deltaproteobacteria bacterium]
MKLCKALMMVVALVFATQTAQAAELKLATLAPQGTSLYKGLEAAVNEIDQKTGGRVKIKIFAGGVQGDEKDVVRKMRYGQIDGAALTGVGMGLINSEVRVLELPFLFNNDAEVDKVYSNMFNVFAKKFEEKGFVLLGWAEVGFVKIFSNKPIKKKKDMSGMKMWMWEGDPLAEEMYKAMGVTPVPLAITDVLTSLQTNLIDAAYAPELGAIAFQWHTKTKFMTDINLVNGTGGILFTNKAWAGVSGGDKKIINEIISRRALDLTRNTRRDNIESKGAVQNSGIKIVTLDPAAEEELKAIGKQVRENLVGRLYPQELLDQVLGYLK